MHQMLHKSNINSVCDKGQVTIYGQECLYQTCKHHSHFQPSLKWHQYIYYNTFWMKRIIDVSAGKAWKQQVIVQHRKEW